jgi:hypothetical protein
MIPIKSIGHHGRPAEVFDAMGIVKPRWGLGASGVPVPQGARLAQRPWAVLFNGVAGKKRAAPDIGRAPPWVIRSDTYVAAYLAGLTRSAAPPTEATDNQASQRNQEQAGRLRR